MNKTRLIIIYYYIIYPSKYVNCYVIGYQSRSNLFHANYKICQCYVALSSFSKRQTEILSTFRVHCCVRKPRRKIYRHIYFAGVMELWWRWWNKTSTTFCTFQFSYCFPATTTILRWSETCTTFYLPLPMSNDIKCMASEKQSNIHNMSFTAGWTDESSLSFSVALGYHWHHRWIYFFFHSCFAFHFLLFVDPIPMNDEHRKLEQRYVNWKTWIETWLKAPIVWKGDLSSQFPVLVQLKKQSVMQSDDISRINGGQFIMCWLKYHFHTPT